MFNISNIFYMVISLSGVAESGEKRKGAGLGEPYAKLFYSRPVPGTVSAER